MTSNNEQAKEIEQKTGLKPRHFADFIRLAQIVSDPGRGVPREELEVNWSSFGIPPNVADNLKLLGKKYQYASPHLPTEIIWEQLIPETKSWLIENKNILWQIEEAFPAYDED
jgi:hypothetical protein